MSTSVKAAVAAATIAAVTTAAPTHAALILGYQEIGPATMSVSSGTVNSPTTSSVTYADTFAATGQSLTANPTYTFYDDFVFQIATGNVDTTATTISLGSTSDINNLQVRLYGLPGNSPPVISGPVTGPFEGWSPTINTPIAPGAVVSSNWVAPVNLVAGTYVLEVRGTVTGSTGGSYSGVLDLTPVPLPAALPLLLSGLGLLGATTRRRSAQAHAG